VKSLLTPLAVLALAGAATAQTTILSEDFNSGVVPPVGWTNVNNNGAPTIGWQPLAGSIAWHDDEFIADSDNTMTTPVMDLSGISTAWLHFTSQTHYTAWMANHPNSIGDGISTMEISTDGGLTWTQIWIDVAVVDDVLISVDVDISAWAGMSNVMLGVHLYGTYDQDWQVDDIVIDDIAPGGGGGPTLSVSGTCPGVMTLSGSGLTAGGPVAVVYGPSGAFAVPGGSCAGLVLDISAPSLAAVVAADAAGDVNVAPNIPGPLCGSTLQMIDLTACAATNSVVL
jgi:hypothetical protein